MAYATSRTPHERYLHAVVSLESAFGQGYARARLELASERSQPLQHVQTSFRLEVPREHVLNGRWHEHLLRFAQIGRAAGLGAGHQGTAILKADADNGSESVGPLALHWTVHVFAGQRQRLLDRVAER